MKSLVIGLFILGLTSLSYSQNKNGEVKEIELEDMIVNSLNKDYLNHVSEENKITDFVKELQYQAAKYDITECSGYDGRSNFFKVAFKGDKGKILAIYDKNGKIVKTAERYKDVILPKDIIKYVLTDYPKSTFLKMVYTVNYGGGSDIMKTYKIQILNGNSKKNLRIISNGNVDKSITMSKVN